MKKMLMASILVISFCICSDAFATDWYVRPNTGEYGSEDGTSWANAFDGFGDIAWGSISGGDTLWISGGSSGATYAERLYIQASGSADNHINIRPGAAHPTLSSNHDGLVTITGTGAAGQEAGAGIHYGSADYVTVDGNDGDGNRNIYVYDTEGAGVCALRMANYDIKCLYVRFNYCNSPTARDRFSVCWNADGGSEFGWCKVTYPGSDCIVTGTPARIEPTQYRHSVIHDSEFYNSRDDSMSGNGGVDIYNCIIGPNQTTYGAIGHPDGYQVYSGYLRIWNNEFRENLSVGSTMGLIFISHEMGYHFNHVRIYNNVFYVYGDGYANRNWHGIVMKIDDAGAPQTFDESNMDDIIIVNNTIVNAGWPLLKYSPREFIGQLQNTNWIIKNNIFVDCPRNAAEIGAFDEAGSDIEIDYNVLNGNIQWDGSATYSVSNYNNLFSPPKNNIFGTPTFASYTAGQGNVADFHLSSSDTVAMDAGVDLSSLTDMPDWPKDKDGVSRPQGSGWDIGAYEYVSGAGSNQRASVASFTATPTGGSAPLAVNFTDTSNDPDGTIVEWNWNFGDGGTSTEQSANHTFDNYGTYTVSLRVTDNEGADDSASTTISVYSGETVSTYIEAESGSINSPLTTGSVADPPAAGNRYIYAPDGSGDTTNPTSEAVYSINIPHAGDYHLWLRIYGPSPDNDAMYAGFNRNFNRVYPTQQEKYEWVKVETANLSAGTHQITIGHGEELTRVDLIYVTNDPVAMPMALLIVQ